MGLLSLGEAIDELVGDGDTVALEGSTHLIPHDEISEVLLQCAVYRGVPSANAAFTSFSA